MGKCKDCLYYRKCEDWFYSPYGGVKHTEKPGFICTALECEDDTVIHMHGFIDEETDCCEMYLPKKNNGWIFRNPYKEGIYLVRLKDGTMMVCYFDGEDWFHSCIGIDDVVAWRPLPKDYEGDKDNESN